MFSLKTEEDKIGTKANLEKLASEVADMDYGKFTEGEDYAALAKRYSQQGQRAMDDTIGKVSARTGGMASSYATAAGNQAYNEHMGKLEDAARALYDSQRQEKMDSLGVSKSLYDQNYQERMDNRAWIQWREELNASNDQWNKQYDYTVEQGTKEDAQNQILTILGGAELDENGDLIADIPENLIEASGWDPLTINALKMEAVQNKSVGEIPQPADMDKEELDEWIAKGEYPNAAINARYKEIYGEDIPYYFGDEYKGIYNQLKKLFNPEDTNAASGERNKEIEDEINRFVTSNFSYDKQEEAYGVILDMAAQLGYDMSFLAGKESEEE